MNMPCNWVDLLQVGSVLFMRYELTLSDSGGRIGEKWLELVGYVRSIFFAIYSHRLAVLGHWSVTVMGATGHEAGQMMIMTIIPRNNTVAFKIVCNAMQQSRCKKNILL